MAVAALALFVAGPASAQVGRTTPGEQDAVTNWASDVATQPMSGSGREPVEASRVVLDVEGGAVVVQWSLSYDIYVSAQAGPGQRYPNVQVQATAALERNGLEIARWALAEDQDQGTDHWVRLRATGTASGLFVDRAPGPGRKTYVLRVGNERARRDDTVTVSTRTMICEER